MLSYLAAVLFLGVTVFSGIVICPPKSFGGRGRCDYIAFELCSEVTLVDDITLCDSLCDKMLFHGEINTIRM